MFRPCPFSQPGTAQCGSRSCAIDHCNEVILICAHEFHNTGSGRPWRMEDVHSATPALPLGTLFLIIWRTVLFLCLSSATSLNIFFSHRTSTPSAFEVITETHYINCLLTYLLDKFLSSVGVQLVTLLGPHVSIFVSYIVVRAVNENTYIILL